MTRSHSFNLSGNGQFAQAESSLRLKSLYIFYSRPLRVVRLGLEVVDASAPLVVEQGGECEVEPLKSCSPFPSLLSEAELATLKDEA